MGSEHTKVGKSPFGKCSFFMFSFLEIEMQYAVQRVPVYMENKNFIIYKKSLIPSILIIGNLELNTY